MVTCYATSASSAYTGWCEDPKRRSRSQGSRSWQARRQRANQRRQPRPISALRLSTTEPFPSRLGIRAIEITLPRLNGQFERRPRIALATAARPILNNHYFTSMVTFVNRLGTPPKNSTSAPIGGHPVDDRLAKGTWIAHAGVTLSREFRGTPSLTCRSLICHGSTEGDASKQRDLRAACCSTSWPLQTGVAKGPPTSPQPCWMRARPTQRCQTW